MQGLEHLENDFELAMFLQQTLVGFATGDAGGGSPDDYIKLREYFLNNHITKQFVPSWVRTSRRQPEFLSFIKTEFRTYAERRNFIRKELNPLLEYCES